MAGGILDGPKQNFVGPAEMAEQQRQAMRDSTAAAANRRDPEAEGIDRAAAALGGGSEDDVDKVKEELKQLELYSKEDMDLAEQLLFRGYAEKNYKVLANTTICVTSMSAAEVELVNEMVYEFANAKPEHDPKNPLAEQPGLSAKVVEGNQNLLTIALSFKGVNGTDISPNAGRTLSFIKNGIRSMNNAEVDGDMKKFKEMRDELKKVIWARARELKRVPVPVIDVAGKRRYEFEKMMYDITSREDLLPKS